MGGDKALFVVDGRTLTERVLDSLRPFAGTSLLAGRALPGLDVPAVPDQYDDAGPLGGIASALAAVRTPLALVAACDMPSIAPPLVALLLARATARPDAAAVMCRGDRGLEPLLSVWRPQLALPTLRAALDAGEHAIHLAVARLDTALVLAPAEWRQADPAGASFVNWNAPEDLPANTTLC
jgi:molybdopterin-guanine dinucleotide biosynthesis protein A